MCRGDDLAIPRGDDMQSLPTIGDAARRSVCVQPAIVGKVRMRQVGTLASPLHARRGNMPDRVAASGLFHSPSRSRKSPLSSLAKNSW